MPEHSGGFEGQGDASLLYAVNDGLENAAKTFPRQILKFFGKKELPEADIQRFQKYLAEYPKQLADFELLLEQINPPSEDSKRSWDAYIEEIWSTIFMGPDRITPEITRARARTTLMSLRAHALASKIEGEKAFGQQSWESFLMNTAIFANDNNLQIPTWWRFAGVHLAPDQKLILKEMYEIGDEIIEQGDSERDKTGSSAATAEIEDRQAQARAVAQFERLFAIRDPLSFRTILLGKDPTMV